jgi:hypothetical protein
MDELDEPLYPTNQGEPRNEEVHELEFAVMLLSATVPILLVMVGMLLLRLSQKAAGLLKYSLGASGAASSHAQGMMTIDIKGADGMPDMMYDIPQCLIVA